MRSTPKVSVIKRLSEGWIHPEEFVTHRFSIDELSKGFSIMHDKTEDYCKVMMECIK